jgi:hydrogenase nickel incorporation protein HypB
MCSECGCQRGRPDSRREALHSHRQAADGEYRDDTDEDVVVGREGIRILKLTVSVLEENAKHAELNRRYLRERGVRMFNVVSSPGAGKTTLLLRSIGDLKGRLSICVIEGDQQTTRDAERIALTGIQVVQINTGKACHLDAQMVGRALKELNLENGGVLFVENVGNLVCPADFDLGEEKRIVMLSVTEGDDKPLKYPNIFASSDVMVVTKIDLSPYVDFDLAACVAHARQLKPSLVTILSSARTGEGLKQWYDWLCGGGSWTPSGVEAVARKWITKESLTAA